MRPINIGIGHNNDSVIPNLSFIEIITNGSTNCDNQRADFFGQKHFIETRFFDIQNFTAERQNRLKLTIPSLLGAIMHENSRCERKIMGARHFNIIDIRDFRDFFYFLDFVIIMRDRGFQFFGISAEKTNKDRIMF